MYIYIAQLNKVKEHYIRSIYIYIYICVYIYIYIYVSIYMIYDDR